MGLENELNDDYGLFRVVTGTFAALGVAVFTYSAITYRNNDLVLFPGIPLTLVTLMPFVATELTRKYAPGYSERMAQVDTLSELMQQREQAQPEEIAKINRNIDGLLNYMKPRRTKLF